MKAMKKLFLMAVMLLAGVCAFAQSNNNEPLKGDVNGDGKVDVADIVAIIEIMKNSGTSGETASYYYVGTTPPNTSTVPSASADGWNVIEQGSNQIQIYTSLVDPRTTWYIAIPSSYGYHAYDTLGEESDAVSYPKSNNPIIINGIEYDLFISANTLYRVNAIFKA